MDFDVDAASWAWDFDDAEDNADMDVNLTYRDALRVLGLPEGIVVALRPDDPLPALKALFEETRTQGMATFDSMKDKVLGLLPALIGIFSDAAAETAAADSWANAASGNK